MVNVAVCVVPYAAVIVTSLFSASTQAAVMVKGTEVHPTGTTTADGSCTAGSELVSVTRVFPPAAGAVSTSTPRNVVPLRTVVSASSMEARTAALGGAAWSFVIGRPGESPSDDFGLAGAASVTAGSELPPEPRLIGSTLVSVAPLRTVFVSKR